MQSTVDFQMPFRLLLYMVEIWRGILKDLENGEEKKKDFMLPAIVPIVLYNGKSKWTACRNFKEYLDGYEWFEENTVDFKYILLDINRYTKEELLRMSNLIASVFLLDKSHNLENIVENLKEIMDVFNKLNSSDFKLFKTWLKNIIIRGIESQNKTNLERMISESMEVEQVISNLEITIRKELKKSREEGKIKGKTEYILELLEELGNVPKALRERILKEKDGSVLSSWHKIAARAKSIDDFQKKTMM